MTRRPLRLLHTSDVHLGPATSDPSGRAHEVQCLCPVQVMAALCEQHGVDVLIVAGDLFDHARLPGDYVVDVFNALGRIVANGTEVAVFNGNHDQYDERTPFRPHRQALEDAGLVFFDDAAGSRRSFADGSLQMWVRAMEDHYPGWLPLADPPARPEGDSWYVVGAHGHFTTPADLGTRSSPIVSAHIDATEADYVALGHWHVTTDLRSRGTALPAWYSGASLFGHGAGTMLLVDMVPGAEVSVERINVLDHPAITCR